MAEFDFDVSRPTVTSSTSFTFRDEIRRRSPQWLQRGLAEKILYSIGVHLDGLADAVTAAVQLRFPGAYGAQSLPLLGRERRVRRGPSDTDTTYASRLIPWLDNHRVRGGAYALLGQIYKYFAPNNFDVDLVYRSGARYHMATDGTITRADSQCTWEADANPSKWARWALYYQWSKPVGDDGKWGDAGAWGDGGLWGTDLAPSVAEDLRVVPTEWNNAHSFGSVVLVNGSNLLWGEPAGQLWGDPPGTLWDTAPRVRLPIS